MKDYSKIIDELGPDQSRSARESIILSQLCLWSLRQLESATTAPAGVPAKTDDVDAALKKLTQDMEKEPFRCDIVLAVFTGKLDPTEGKARISKIVQDAPYLDWAIWSDLFLALKYPGERERILKELKEATIPHKILGDYMVKNSAKGG